MTGARPKSEARFSATRDGAREGVLLVLAGGERELALEPAGQLQRVALVGALVAEPSPRGWPLVDDLAGPVGSHDSGRRGGDS